MQLTIEKHLPVPMRDGVLLATDDNFNPLQRSHLARLVPRQQSGCSAPPHP